MHFFKTIIIILFCSTSYANDVLTDFDLHGAWQAEFAKLHKDSMLGKLKWIQITFQIDNRVEWTWEREGKIEKHKGRYTLTTKPAKDGRQKTTTITLLPQTMAVYRDIPLQNVSFDHDSRFALPEKVLKCKDHGGNVLVFSKVKHKSK